MAPTFLVGERVRIQSSGKYGGRGGTVVRYESVIDRAGGYPYTVSVGGNFAAFKAANLQRVDEAVEA